MSIVVIIVGILVLWKMNNKSKIKYEKTTLENEEEANLSGQNTPNQIVQGEDDEMDSEESSSQEKHSLVAQEDV